FQSDVTSTPTTGPRSIELITLAGKLFMIPPSTNNWPSATIGGTSPGIAAEARSARQRYPSLCTIASPLDRLADTQKKGLPGVFDHRIAAVLHQQTPHPAAPRQSDDRNGIVCDRIPSESAQ